MHTYVLPTHIPFTHSLPLSPCDTHGCLYACYWLLPRHYVHDVQLTRDLGGQVTIPPLPPKVMINNMKPEVVESRRVALEAYLKAITSHERSLQHEAVREGVRSVVLGVLAD